MEVILREHVDNLGRRGEIVKVTDGYARNYLLPRKLALPATEGNKKHIERERKIFEAREAEDKAQAEGIASRLTAVDIVITRRVGDTEQLYGSVTAVDIADFLKSKGFEVDRRKLILPEPIKTLGEHGTPVSLKPVNEPQGEGISIGPNGTVYLASEGKKKQPGTLRMMQCRFPASDGRS